MKTLIGLIGAYTPQGVRVSTVYGDVEPGESGFLYSANEQYKRGEYGEHWQEPHYADVHDWIALMRFNVDTAVNRVLVPDTVSEPRYRVPLGYYSVDESSGWFYTVPGHSPLSL
jgi:hypothetical protein